VDKLSNEPIKQIVPGTLKKGKTKAVAKNLYMLWCELPGCNCVKLTHDVTARACTREHMKQLEKYENRKNAQGL